MQLSIKGFIKPKESELFYDCADRFAYNKVKNKFCISDGVSKSFFPKIWADILVNTWVNENWNSDEDFIAQCQKLWLEDVTNIVQKPDTKWFTKNAFNRRESALATFVGLNFEYHKNQFYWKAQALGDSFLFFVPKTYTDFKEETISVSSKKDPVVFDNFPDYLSSLGLKHKGEKRSEKKILEEGTFYLMTDALAEWFLNEKENAIHRINVWTGQRDFELFVDEERLTKRLGNDDSAILIIEVKNDGNDCLNYSKENTADIDDLIENENKTTIDTQLEQKNEILDSEEIKEQSQDPANQISASKKLTEENPNLNQEVEKIEEVMEAEINNEVEKNGPSSGEEKKSVDQPKESDNNHPIKKSKTIDKEPEVTPEIKKSNPSQNITDKF